MNSSYSTDTHAQVTLADVLLILWRRLWVIALILATAVGTAAYVTKNAPKRWKATAQLLLVQRAAPVITPGTQSIAQGPIVDSTDTQVAMLESLAMAQRTIDWMKNDANDAITHGRTAAPVTVGAEELQKAISASSPKDTNLIDITVESETREQAVYQANAVCKAFVQWKKEVAQQNFQETQTSLKARLARAQTERDRAERAELDFKRTHALVDVAAQQGAVLQRSEKSDDAVRQLKQDVATQEARLHLLAQRLHATDAAIDTQGPSARNDLVTANLQATLNDLQSQRADLLQRFNERHPDVIALDKKIKTARDRLDQAVRDALNDRRPSLDTQASLQQDYRDAEMQVRYTRAQLAEAIRVRDQERARLAGIPLASVAYARLSQNTANTRALYNNLEAALSTIRVNQDMESGNVQIAQEGYAPEKAFLPNHLRDMMLGAGVGILLAFAAVLLLEQSDRRLRDLEGIRRVVPGPIVGALPRMSRGQIAGMIEGDAPAVAETAYSLANANLSLALRDIAEHQVILITSTVPGEGKSLTAASLARSIARSGKSVVLVDADMRRPSLNVLFNMDEPHGLADVLIGGKELDEVLVSSDTENLTLLPSGNASHNPTDLVARLAMIETLQALRRDADVIIVDTPACAVVADALLLAPHADCILHVIGAGLVDETLARDTIQDLSAADPKLMAFFVNRVGGHTPHRRYYAYNGAGAGGGSSAGASGSGGSAGVAVRGTRS